MKNKNNIRLRRAKKTRSKVRVMDKHRLTVFRSSRHIYGQIIDDASGKTLASASTMDKQLRENLGFGGNQAAAVAVGQEVAARAKAAGVSSVCFDRGAFQYHGRVAALADAAREAGLNF